MARKSKSASDWTATPEGRAQYEACRAAAQSAANADGFDRGIERNDLFKTYRSFFLPMRQNRYGYELSCEVVSCEDISRCRPGHGPNGAR